MNDKMYLDRDGLKYYDALIKDYIDNKIAEAIAEYEARDDNIHEYDPDPTDDE